MAGLAIAILGWLLHSGRLDPTQLYGAARRWRWLLGIGGVCCAGFFLTAMRWGPLLTSLAGRARGAKSAPSWEGASGEPGNTTELHRACVDDMGSPLVTIVTPSFNQGRFIRATIESVLNQDYPNIEYLIMDGGSTDETTAVAKDYASRVTFLSEKDRGQSHAINKGFQRANGTIVAWLNSDDLLLPGAVSKAVRVFREKPATGAVYGEGYLIDLDGNITRRFPSTEPLNLWKLVHLSDYILQQTVFFRRDVIRELGYLDESLHYTMDWDIFIKIAARWPLEYVPEYMGCLREYPEAKSSAGGAKRVREITSLLRRHTGMRLPHGAIVYGLETYHKIWCEKIAAYTPGFLNPVSRLLQGGVTAAAGRVIGQTIVHSQGLYSDGWAAPVLRYMLPQGRGHLSIEGAVPDRFPSLRGQTLAIECNGRIIGRFPLSGGKFSLQAQVPEEYQGRTLMLKLRARRWMVRARIPLWGDRRRLAYMLAGIRWSEPFRADWTDRKPAFQSPGAADRE
jgi:glycosyltransferase involved in cell wall biosynthesis